MADSASELNRRAMMEKEREKMLSEFARKKEQISKESEVHIGSDKYVSQNHDVESQLKFDTVGLVNLEEYRSIREKLEKKRQHDGEAKGKVSN
ncbi:hypothetical protein HMI54_003850, partial [Coelomomyces lativittatus]